MTTEVGLQTTTFGPCRAIGIAYTGKNANNEIPGLWSQFVTRVTEIDRPETALWFGVCRCLPGSTDGSFEYVAAVQATEGSPLPAGMTVVDIPQGDYAVFEAPDSLQLRAVWDSVPAQLAAAAEEWAAYCGPAGCGCATHPCFECYPPNYCGTGAFQVYVPVKRKGA